MRLIGVLLFPVVAFVACMKGDGKRPTATAVLDSPAYVFESAIGLVNLTASESEGVNVANFATTNPPATACAFSAHVACVGAGSVITYNNCSIATATMKGQWNQTFDSSNSCTTAYGGGNGAALPANGTLTIKSAGIIATYPSGNQLTTSTVDSVNFRAQTIQGSQGMIIQMDPTSAQRTINFTGVRRTLTSSTGTFYYDHTVLSDIPLTVTGQLSDGSRNLNSGRIITYHNRAKYIATISFNNLIWGSASCCYPTSGSMAASLTGSSSGDLTMTFTSACGTAIYQDQSGTAQQYTLSHCE